MLGVSVKKASDNAGRPLGKKGYVILFDYDDVATFTKDAKGVLLTAFSLAQGKTPIGVYATNSSIKATSSIEGEDDARGYIHKLAYEHPGTPLEYDELMNNLANKNIGAIVIDCGNSNAKILGTPCTPLKVTKDDSEDGKDNNKNSVELSSSLRSGPIGRIPLSLIPATDDNVINAALGLPAAPAGSAGSTGL